MADLWRKRKPILLSQRVFRKGKVFTCLVIVRGSLRIAVLRVDSSFKTISISPISLMTWSMIWESTWCSMASIQCESTFMKQAWHDLQRSPTLHPGIQTWPIYSCIWPITRLTRRMQDFVKIRAVGTEECRQAMRSLSHAMDLMTKKVGTRDHSMPFLKFSINKALIRIRFLTRSRTSLWKL